MLALMSKNWWAVAILVWSLLTTFGGPLRILGPGFHYMKTSVFPTAYALSVTPLTEMSEPPQFAGGLVSPGFAVGSPPRLTAPSERLDCAVMQPAPLVVGHAMLPAAGITATVACAGASAAPTDASVKLGAPFGSCNATEAPGQRCGPSPKLSRLAETFAARARSGSS